MDLIIDGLWDGFLDTVKMLPFLIAAFFVLELLEEYSQKHQNNLLARMGAAGPAAGALLGCIPQCGFSVAATNLYAGGVITIGTLMSVFLSTSDEAVILLMAEPGKGAVIGKLLLTKIILGMVLGYLVDIIFRKSPMKKKRLGEICEECGCEEEHGLLHAVFHHTAQVFLFLLLFNCVLSVLLSGIGIEQISAALLIDTPFQPMLAALIGLIPNCAASVVLTQLYLVGALSFGSVVAGLLSGAGIGLAVLFKMNKNKKENLIILGVLYLCAVIPGMILQLIF